MSFVPVLFIYIYLVFSSLIFSRTRVASFCNLWNISLRAFGDLSIVICNVQNSMQLVPVVPYVKLENRIYQDYDINLNICNSSIYQHCYTELQYIQ